MKQHSDSGLIEVSASELDIDAIVASFANEGGLNESVRIASVLVLPTDLGSEYKGPAFPVSTPFVFRHLKAGFAEKATVEVAVRDKDYREFEYLSDSVILPVIYVANHILLPLLVSLLGTFLYSRFESRSSGTVKSEVHFTDPTGAQVYFKYEGPASSYQKVAADHLRKLGVWLERDQLPDDNK